MVFDSAIINARNYGRGLATAYIVSRGERVPLQLGRAYTALECLV